MGAVKTSDDDGLEKHWLEVAQVDSVPGARVGLQGFPVGHDAARLAAHVPQRAIAPDVLFRVLGMTLNRDCSERVVGPDTARTTAERAVATGCSDWRKWKSEADCSAMAGTVERWCRLRLTHGLQSSKVVAPHTRPTTRMTCAGPLADGGDRRESAPTSHELHNRLATPRPC